MRGSKLQFSPLTVETESTNTLHKTTLQFYAGAALSPGCKIENRFGLAMLSSEEMLSLTLMFRYFFQIYSEFLGIYPISSPFNPLQNERVSNIRNILYLSLSLTDAIISSRQINRQVEEIK